MTPSQKFTEFCKEKSDKEWSEYCVKRHCKKCRDDWEDLNCTLKISKKILTGDELLDTIKKAHEDAKNSKLVFKGKK